MLDKNQVKLAIAPIAWTNDDMPDLGKENTFEQCVSEMALAGFTGSEVGSKYPKDPSVLKPLLDIRNIQICNQWFSSLLMSEPYEVTIRNFKEQLKFLKAMGSDIIGASEQGNSIQGTKLPIFEAKPVINDAQWEVLAKGFNEMGKIAHDNGVSFTYHHHMGTCIQTMAEVDKFMELTDPELVFLLFDSGHFAFSDEDPTKALQKYIKRVRHVHLKDIRRPVVDRVHAEKMSFLEAVRAGAFTVPGDGDIDFKPIFDILAENNYKGWMVVEAEQDPAIANPFEYALKARKYIRDMTGL